MDHLGITNTVDSTSAFKVAGVATADLPTSSDFWVWYVKMPLWILATKIFFRLFSPYFRRMPESLFIITVCKHCLFYMRGKSVLCTVHFTVPVYSVSSFCGTFEASKTKQKKCRSCYRWNTTGLHKWTGGPIMIPCILLQTVGTVRSFPTIIWVLMFLYLCSGLL